MLLTSFFNSLGAPPPTSQIITQKLTLVYEYLALAYFQIAFLKLFYLVPLGFYLSLCLYILFFSFYSVWSQGWVTLVAWLGDWPLACSFLYFSPSFLLLSSLFILSAVHPGLFLSPTYLLFSSLCFSQAK